MPACSRAWKSPSTTPPKSATSATTRYAAVSRSSGFRSMARVPVVMGRDSSTARASEPWLDDPLPPQGVGGDPAVLVTEEGVLAWTVEAGRDARDLPGNEHHIDVGPGDEEPVEHVPAGGHERDRRAGRDPDLVWREDPDAAHHPDLVLSGPDLHGSGLVEGGRGENRRRLHASLVSRQMHPRPEGEDDEGHQHPDRDRDTREDPEEFVQVDRGATSHGVLPEPQVDVEPEPREEEQIHDRKEQGTLGMLVLVHGSTLSGRGIPLRSSDLPRP